jgi:hypothetical protein
LNALAKALIPAEADAVIAISSGCAPNNMATCPRTASFFITQISQLAPTISRSSI